MTDFRRPDLDLWEEEAEDEDGRPTLVGPRPVSPTESAAARPVHAAPAELIPTPAFGRVPSGAAREAQARLREAEVQARQREARSVDPQRALALQAAWAEARGLSPADTTLTDDLPPFHDHEEEDTRPIPPNFPAMLADSELADLEPRTPGRAARGDAIEKLRAGELPGFDAQARTSFPAEELRASEVDRLTVRPADEWGAFVDGLAEHVAHGPPVVLPAPRNLPPSRPVPQHTLRGLGTPGVAEGIAEGLRSAPTPLPAPAALASSWPPVAQPLTPRTVREPVPTEGHRNAETERLYGARKAQDGALQAALSPGTRPAERQTPAHVAAPAVPPPRAPAPGTPVLTPAAPRMPQLVPQSQPVPMPVPMPSIAPASDAPVWADEAAPARSGVTWWQLAGAAVMMAVVGAYVSSYGRHVSRSSQVVAAAAKLIRGDAAPSLPPHLETPQPPQAEAQLAAPAVPELPAEGALPAAQAAVTGLPTPPVVPNAASTAPAPSTFVAAVGPQAVPTVSTPKPQSAAKPAALTTATRTWGPTKANKPAPSSVRVSSVPESIVPAPRPSTAAAEASGSAEAREPASEPAQPLPSAAAATGNLPAQPDREAILAAMSSIMPALQSCVGDNHGAAELKLTIRSQGFVSYALIGGDFAGTKEGSCIAQAVRQAKFPAFSDPVLRLTYPVRL